MPIDGAQHRPLGHAVGPIWPATNGSKDPDFLAPGEVRILWYVTTDNYYGTGSGQHGVLEGAPFRPAHPKYGPDENFLSFFTHPVHPSTGERLNFLRLPVLDGQWNESCGDKGGFIQEVLGWKPAPLLPKVNVQLFAKAAGVYWPK
ncbi:hypothetical protein ABZ260_35165 [Streptosporangium sp. NPDC006013]|uniref:hypothetical protein n=1 Tax=Streptosporangium sp. NPDC006013 TaxID=3155596 RepID=UPI0033A5FB7F